MTSCSTISISSDFSALSSAMEDGKTFEDRSLADGVPSLRQAHCADECTDTTGSPKSADVDVKQKSSSVDEKKSPGLPYIALISMAIQSSAEKRILLSEIYQWIAARYPYYSLQEKSWRNSIRHNLSLNECFVKNGRSENGKGNYWSIHPANIDDFSNGDFRRRRARRRVRKCDEDLKRLCSRSPYTDSPPPKPDSSDGSADSYIPMSSTKVPTSFLSSLGMGGKPQDDWTAQKFPYCANPAMYTPCDLGYYQGDLCSQYFPYQQPDSVPSAFRPAPTSHHSTRPTGAAGELNVNVNVNVCGNSGSSRQCVSPQTSPCYISPCVPEYRPPFSSPPYGDQGQIGAYSGGGPGNTGWTYHVQGQQYGSKPSHAQETDYSKKK